MATKFTSTLLLCLLFSLSYSQGYIDHIKNQKYLKYKVDCNNLDGDNLSSRICANLAFQKSDSILVVVYNSILQKARSSQNDSLRNKVIQLQVSWRRFRDQHCQIIYDTYEGCASCHVQATSYLQCLKELTDNRITELKSLEKQVVGY